VSRLCRTVGPVSKSFKSSKRQIDRLDPQTWIDAGRRALIGGGVASIKIAPLAKTLRVTTGSFYWHFKNVPTFLDALLENWEEANTAPMFDAVAAHPSSAVKQFDALTEVWLAETNYYPMWDSAVRDWARVSPKVEAAVRRIDDKRIKLLHGIFKRLGFAEPCAFVRARITYFHQVGYYALRIVERRADRLRLSSVYRDILRGRPSVLTND
jgi:AcrR family transcriptional regulator